MSDPTNHSHQATNQDDWQKLSQVAILFFTVRTLKAMVSNFIYLIPAVALSYETIMQNSHIWVPVFVGGIGLIFFLSFAHYHFYRFRLRQQLIEIRAGVFAKKHLNLPFARIQNVKIEQPFYYRPFGYACLELDTAGSSEREARIVAIKVKAATQLKDHILKHHAEHDTVEHNSSAQVAGKCDATNGETLLNRRSVKDLIIHGLTNNRVLIFLGLLAPFYDNLAEFVFTRLQSLGIDLEVIFTSQTLAWWQLGLYALSLTMVILTLLALVSIAGSILVFYDFRLSRTPDRYIKRCGLLSKQEVSMKLSRLQIAIKQQDWLDRVLGRSNLVLQQNKPDVSAPADLSSASKIMVPSVNENQCLKLMQDAMPGNNIGSIEYHAISQHYLLRMMLFMWLPLSALAICISIISNELMWIMASLGASLLLALLTYLRWKRWGYATDENYIYVRKGTLGIDLHCFALHKIQQICLKQSLFMRRRQLTSLKIVLASGTVHIPFMPEYIALQWSNRFLFAVESQKRSWM